MKNRSYWKAVVLVLSGLVGCAGDATEPRQAVIASVSGIEGSWRVASWRDANGGLCTMPAWANQIHTFETSAAPLTMTVDSHYGDSHSNRFETEFTVDSNGDLVFAGTGGEEMVMSYTVFGDTLTLTTESVSNYAVPVPPELPYPEGENAPEANMPPGPPESVTLERVS